MSKRTYILLPLLILLVTVLIVGQVKAAAPEVYWLKADGAINPPLADYLIRGISQAEEAGAAACVIELNTPGGLLTSTREIVDRILAAKVPIVVYASWAASAGTFITLAADVAAMTPGGNIGAASPVSIGGEEIPSTEEKKVIEDARALISEIATERGRNVGAAELTVLSAFSFSAQEATGEVPVTQAHQEELGDEWLDDEGKLDPPLVDFIADNAADLLAKLETEKGLPVANARLIDFNMSTMERFLYAISDPNIAYILLNIAILGILIELGHPGLIVPGVIGGICLILSIYSLDILEANWAGLILVILAFGLFVAEIFTPTFGFLTAGGIVSLVLGSLMLFRGSAFQINYGVLGGVAAFMAAIIFFVIGAVVRGQRRRAVTGYEGMIGKVAIAQTELDPEGMVFVKGERWKAVSEKGKIEPDEEVIITKVDGLKLRVTKKS